MGHKNVLGEVTQITREHTAKGPLYHACSVMKEGLVSICHRHLWEEKGEAGTWKGNQQ